MVALCRTAAPVASAVPVGLKPRQTPVARTLSSDQTFPPCDRQISFRADSARQLWTAAGEADRAPPLSTGNDLTALSAAKRAKGPAPGTAGINHSMYSGSTGHSTHLKVVVVSLLCATVVSALGLLARAGDVSAERALSRSETIAPVTRAGGPKTVTIHEHNTIR